MANIGTFSLNNEKLFKLILRRAPERISTELDGETVVLDMISGMYLGLDAIGTFIWKQLERSITVAALRDSILETYDVSEAQCVADLLLFLNDLSDNGLIVIETGDGFGR